MYTPRDSTHYSAALISILLFSTAYATSYTARTYLAERPIGTFLPFEYPKPSNKNITVRIAPLFQWSRHNEHITKYFFPSCSPLRVGSPAVGAQIDHCNLKFDETTPNALSGILNFAPHTHTTGAYIQYYQRWHRIFYTIALPIVHTMHTLGMYITCSTPASTQPVGVATYFRGGDMRVERQNQHVCPGLVVQEPLTSCRIDGPCSTSGVADIYLDFGYQISDCAAHRLSLQASLIAPTTRPARNRFLFEPRLGYGGHWVVGGRVDGSVEIVHSNGATVTLDGILRAHYIIPHTEHRTFGLRSASGAALPLAQYQIVGALGFPFVIPGANALTQLVRVSPRQEWEGLLAARYEGHGIQCALGYDFWSRMSEHISPRVCWSNNRYAFPGSDYAVELANAASPIGLHTTAFTLTDANTANTIAFVDTRGIAQSIQASQLCYERAGNPSTMVHTIFAYLSTPWKTGLGTFECGIGGACEMPTNNAALARITLWLSASANF